MAKRIREAHHYQRQDSHLKAIADRVIPLVRRDVKASLKGLSDLVPGEADRLARAGDWQGIKSSVHWNHFREVMSGVFSTIGKTRENAAQFGVQQINNLFSKAGRKVRYRKTRRGAP